MVPGRNASQCHYKWSLTQKPGNTKIPWTSEEDQVLIQIIEKKGIQGWASIAKELNSKFFVNSRLGKQCRERWFNHLDHDIARFVSLLNILYIYIYINIL